MRLSPSAMILASLAAASAVVGAACSFPQIGFWTESSTAGGGGPAEASSVSASASASVSASVGAGGGGGGGASGASSSSAGGGGASSSASSSSGGPPCPVDEDQDGAISKQCPGGKDCADHDFSAHPEPQVDFQAGPIQGAKAPGTQPFDFNCDGSEVGETPVLNCSGCNNPPSLFGFKDAVACGQSGALGHCKNDLLNCHWEAENPPKNKVQRCK